MSDIDTDNVDNATCSRAYPAAAFQATIITAEPGQSHGEALTDWPPLRLEALLASGLCDAVDDQ
ncbi:MAG TPA: hypothetical protein VG673_10210 [Actinomycetota bacterium]|nr:hypothetical protein [Actinomycetota bacterium]